MDCPFCGKEMKEGLIPSRDRLQWRDKSYTERVFLSSWTEEARAFFCPDCRQVVIPALEIEGVWDKMKRKLNAASEELGAMRERLEERHTQAAQAKSQREKEKKGKQDPWEL